MKKHLYAFLAALLILFIGNMAFPSQALASAPIYLGGSGGDGGKPCLAYSNWGTNSRLAEVRVWSGQWIDAIQVVYVNKSTGQYKYSAKCGGSGGTLKTLSLDADEYIRWIHGWYGNYIDSITMITNKNREITWGGSGGPKDYHYGAWKGLKIDGFQVSAGQFLDSIGVYSTQTLETPSFSSFGPAGGMGGDEYYIKPYVNDSPRVTRVTVCAGQWIDSIKLEWSDNRGVTYKSRKIGGNGGKCSSLKLGRGEYIQYVQGKRGQFVDSLVIITNTGTSKRWGGKGGTQSFFYEAPYLGKIVGFHGGAGTVVDSIGVEVRYE